MMLKKKIYALACMVLFCTAFRVPVDPQAPTMPIKDPRLELKRFIFRPMLDLQDIEWIQWFGPTVFAYEEGDYWEYTLYCQGQHCGLDFGAPWGTPIYAGVFGKVVYASHERIDLWVGENPDHGWWSVIFMNIAEVYVVAGDWVTPNTILGTVGNHKNEQYYGGIFVDHLHLELLYDEDPEETYKSEFHNPLHYFYDTSFYDKLAQIAEEQVSWNDWFYIRDAALMGLDDPLAVQMILRGPGKMEKDFVSILGQKSEYINYQYYIDAYSGEKPKE